VKRSTEVVEHREGGDPSGSRKSPGRTKYEPITLERGVTHDKEFERWANKVWNYGAGLGSEVSLKDFRKRSSSKCTMRPLSSQLLIEFINTGFQNSKRTVEWLAVSESALCS